MPEGDTLHRAKLRLEPILSDALLTDVWFRKLRGHKPRVGQRIETVDAVGKHLLIDFDRNLTLRTHLGMAGSWRVAGVDSDVRRLHADPRLRIRLSTDKGHGLCYAAPDIQTHIRTVDPDPVAHLGPDLVLADPPLDEVLRRVRHFGESDTFLCDLLLDQRIASGIGNVYKSEVLHLERLYPFDTLGQHSDETIVAAYEVAARELHRNSQHADQRRVTLRHGQFSVYGRWRQGCVRCSGSIRRSYRGTLGRSTYWCSHCQPAAR